MEARADKKENHEQKSKLVQMRLQEKTLEKLQNLSKLTDTSNKTQLISSSIQLTEELVKSMVKDHAKVYIEMPNGQKQLIKIIGL
ncbi:MAG TPA: hypothetical protein VFR70_00040 [Flavobacterium sp.]|nr:hypothetical protein [Flavobacterium sp.]